MNDIFYYLLIPVSALITASSQILLKISAQRQHKDFIHEYLNACVIISYAFYFLVVFLNIFIYTKVDYRFSVVLNSLSTVFVAVFSNLILKERFTRRRILGNILIVLGIVCFTIL